MGTIPSQITKFVEVLKYIRKTWYTFLGYITTTVLAFLLEKVLLPKILTENLAYILAIYSGTAICILIIWLLSRRAPKTKRGKVGFMICINYYTEKERNKIREDLVLTLRKLVKSGRTADTFHFIEIPEFIAKKINDLDRAFQLLIACRAHFLLYGQVKERKIDGKQSHYISLEGLVSHTPIPKKVSEKLSSEFTEFLPRRLVVQEENDILTFEFTTVWLEYVAKYIIGVAAGLSGDFDYSERLFQEVLDKLKPSKHPFQIYKKLRKRIPKRLSEIYEKKASIAFRKWIRTRDKEYIEELGRILGKVESPFSSNYGVLILKSIHYFLDSRNVIESKKYLKKCEKVSRNDGTWLFNLGFLQAYEGDLKSATRCYRFALNCSVEQRVILDIEEFIFWVLEEEKEKEHLYFCLGYINQNFKQDSQQAIRDYKTFIDKCISAKFSKERELAIKWSNELQQDVVSEVETE